MKKLIYILFPLLTACTWDEVISTPEDYRNSYTRTDTTYNISKDTIKDAPVPLSFNITIDGWTEVKDTINF